AAVVEAVAAHLVALDEGDRHAQLGSGGGERQPARAAADDAQIDARIAPLDGRQGGGTLLRAARRRTTGGARAPHAARTRTCLLHDCLSISSGRPGSARRIQAARAPAAAPW